MSKTRDFLGPYRLARLIRAGSISEVWEAVEENEQKRYALKVLKRSSCNDKHEIASLKHEFNVAKDLNSPRIVKMYEHRVESGVPFLVMELFSELNMKQALRRGPDSLAFILKKIVQQAAEGLYYMHTQKWIHRDVKPDNFLVSRDGVTKLIDFTIAEQKKSGLSKLFHRSGGTVQGTRSYMAPEQIRGKICDERTDVYSFGCVVYEAATGKPPYTGQSPNDLLSKHLNASIPSAIAYNNNLTKDLADLLKAMMAKRPDDRPDSMYDFMKVFKSIEIFRKRPKAPETSVFDEMPGIRGSEDMLMKDAAKNDGEEES